MKKFSLKQIFRIVLASKIVGFLLILIGAAFVDSILPVFFVFGSIGLLLILAGVFIDAVYYVCPKCGLWLGSAALPSDYCRHCGTKVDQEEDKKGD